MRYILIILFLFITLFCNGQNNKRIALIIGNAEYAYTTKLENTVNDAKVIAGALKAVQFQVIYKENLSRKDFLEQLSIFIALVNDSSCEAGFFYYAGHGIQFENNNYLVPIDAKIEKAQDAEDYCIALQKLNRIASSNNKVIITVLDACRNNPFESSRSTGNGGLAKTNAVSGSLIAYSTEPGKVAFDGKGMENSVYSKTLAKYITEPNLALEQVFKLVRTEVEQKTKNQQSPREESALKGEPFYFNKKIDFSKIDIKDIENEMKALSLNKKYNEALLKGNVLKNIYQERTDSISRLKYVSILLNIAKLNWQIANDTIHPLESYLRINYYKNASIALYDAIEIFKKNELNTNQHKLLYSKLLINYISIQSLLFEKDRIGSVDNLYSLSNELIKFNELNFGFNDYKTACAYFNVGYLKKDTLPLESYNIINKGYKIINDNYIINNLKNNEDYIFDDANKFFHIIKWSLLSLNNLIDLDLKTDEINKLLLSKSTYLYQNTKDEIDKNIVYLSNIHHPKINDYLHQCSVFYNNYSLILTDKLKGKLFEDALFINNIKLQYCKDYSDSINLYENHIISLTNIIDFNTEDNPNYIPANDCERIFNLLNECIKLAYNNDYYQIILTATNFIYRSDRLSKYNKKCFNNENLYKELDKFNDAFGNIMSEYKLSENKDQWNEYLDAYFNQLREYFNNHDSINYNYKLIEAEQYIEFTSNCNIYGYGTPSNLAAMQHYAVKLGESNRPDDQEESHKLYIKLIKLNNQYSKKWTERDIEYYTGNKNKEECLSILLSDIYLNYGDNLIEKHKDVNNFEDSTLIHSYLKFTEDYKASLLSLNRLYHSKIPAIQLMVLYYSSINPQKSIEYCDMGILLLKERLNLDAENAKLDQLENYYAEYYITWFFDQKLEIIKQISPDDYSKVVYQYIAVANKFKAYDKYGTLFSIYTRFIDYYYFIKKDFNLAKKTGHEAYKEYGKYLNSNEFLFSDLSKGYKLYVKSSFNRILSRLSASSLFPTIADRKLCIDNCKKTVDFIYKNWKISEIIEDSYIFDCLSSTLLEIEDKSYFLGDYKTAIEYANKQLDVLELFKDGDFKQSKKRTIHDLMAITYFAVKDTLNATLSYCKYVNNTNNFDTTLVHNINYTLENKKFNTCSIPYLHFTIYAPLNSWPCLEFDVNNNTKIDFLSDLRYFIDTNNVINKENIKRLDQYFGGFYFYGLDEFGNNIDTTSNIFFDKNKPLKTLAYFQTQKLNINTELKFGKLKIGEQLNKWDIFIPIEEIYFENNNSVNLIYSNILKGESNYIASRRYVKNTIPSKSYYTGFKDGIKIKIQ